MVETPAGAAARGERAQASPARRIGLALFIVLVVAVAGVVFARWQARSDAGKNVEFASGGEQAEVVKISVEGMSCSGCAGTVAAEIKKVPGVADCDVDMKRKMAVVTLARADVDRDALVAAVEQAGYEAEIESEK
jgi:copper chaperone CopZ